MRKEEKEIMVKLEEYSRWFRYHKPDYNTVFRKYKQAIESIAIIVERINENPFHPENDHREEILYDIQEQFDVLEEIKSSI